MTIHHGEPDRDELIRLIARAAFCIESSVEWTDLHPDDRDEYIAAAIDVLDALAAADLTVTQRSKEAGA